MHDPARQKCQGAGNQNTSHVNRHHGIAVHAQVAGSGAAQGEKDADECHDNEEMNQAETKSRRARPHVANEYGDEAGDGHQPEVNRSEESMGRATLPRDKNQPGSEQYCRHNCGDVQLDDWRGIKQGLRIHVTLSRAVRSSVYRRDQVLQSCHTGFQRTAGW